MTNNPESLTPEALETLLKEADMLEYEGVRDYPATVRALVQRLSTALRSLSASHASTEAEAFKAGWRERGINDWSSPEVWGGSVDDALAFYREQKGRVTP